MEYIHFKKLNQNYEKNESITRNYLFVIIEFNKFFVITAFSDNANLTIISNVHSFNAEFILKVINVLSYLIS